MADQTAPENRGRSAASRRRTKPPEGRRFQPGVSGNPGGRPKGLARAVRERLTDAAGESSDGAEVLVGFWSSIVADKQQKTTDRIACSKLLATYGWGQPPAYAPVEEGDPLDSEEQRLADAVNEFNAEVVRLASLREAGEARPAGSPEA